MEASPQGLDIIVHSNRPGGVVIPFPRAARVADLQRVQAAPLSVPSPGAHRIAVLRCAADIVSNWRPHVCEALVLAAMLAVGAVQALILLTALGVHIV